MILTGGLRGILPLPPLRTLGAMGAPPSFTPPGRVMSLTFLSLIGCSVSPVTGEPSPPPVDPWRAEISARVRDDMHSFLLDGDGFVAESPEVDVAGRFDVSGVWLERGGDVLGVSALGWGRRGTLDRPSPAPPRLGACVPGMEDPEGACVQRLEYLDAGITTWWASGTDGFTQGWDIEAAPGGDGPLVVDVGLDDAMITVGDGEVWVQGDGGELWNVSALSAWDADGVALAASFEGIPGGFRVVVDDTNARYPIVVDPLYSTASATLTGESSSNYFGVSLDGAGDVNGDGYDDVIIGADSYNSGTGRVYVYHGSASGLSTTANRTLTGAGVSYYFGVSVAGVGDVNRDGYGDVMIGADGYNSYTGRAYLYLGSASGIGSLAKSTFAAPTTGIDFGYTLAGAGDVNGDGYDDVIIGAGYYNSGTGRAYVYRGMSTGVTLAVATTLTGEAVGDYFGDAVAGVGDVNGDGYDDVLVGAEGNESGTGRAYLYLGSPTGLSSTVTTTLSGATMGDYFGISLAGAGDVNDDGHDDVIVGAYGYGASIGRAYVYHGTTGGLSTTAATTITGETTSNYLGGSVAGVGDVNNDGCSDVAVGADYYSAGRGRVYLHEGSASGVSATAVTTLTGVSAGDRFGYAVAGAGDVNNDGNDDLLVGATGYSIRTGRAYVFHGYTDSDGDGYASTVDCNDADPAINSGAQEVCDGANVDEDCDGLADDADVSVTGRSSYYADGDGDGYGVGQATSACEGPVGYALVNDDCNDADPAVNPGAVEVCDAHGVDEDCDRLADNADASATLRNTYYVDGDGDGYGGASTGEWCELPGGYALTYTDCDDSQAAIHPGANEVCDSANVDENCDGRSDNADGTAAGTATVYSDLDGDGYGGAAAGSYCDVPEGYVGSSTDCDDLDAAIHPGAAEVCDAANTDEDCDGVSDDVDILVTGQGTYYLDNDRDGYGGPLASAWCDHPVGYTVDSTDCEDANLSVHPGASEVCDDVDNDCDASVDDGLDCLAPVAGSVLINGGAAYANSSVLILTLSAADNVGVAEMCVATTTTCTAWQPYAETLDYTVGTGDTTVYASFRDAAGLVSGVVSDAIDFDRTAPTDTTLTGTPANRSVNLAWTGYSDADSGVASFIVVRASDATAPANCTTGTTVYAGSTPSTTVSGLTNGTAYGFRLCVVDNAGNVSPGSTSTVYAGADRIAPTGTVSINAGAAWTRSRAVTLTLSATDDRGVTEMCVSYTGACSTWETYATTRAWTIYPFGSTGGVWAAFRDAQGNVSATVWDVISFDATRPTNGTVTGTGAVGTASLIWSGFSDATSGIASYTVAQSAGVVPASCTSGSVVYTGAATSTTVSGLTRGTYGYRVCATDAAGNVSSGATLSLFVH